VWEPSAEQRGRSALKVAGRDIKYRIRGSILVEFAREWRRTDWGEGVPMPKNTVRELCRKKGRQVPLKNRIGKPTEPWGPPKWAGGFRLHREGDLTHQQVKTGVRDGARK